MSPVSLLPTSPVRTISAASFLLLIDEALGVHYLWQLNGDFIKAAGETHCFLISENKGLINHS